MSASTAILERILLIDRNEPLARAWETAFEEYEEVEVICGDFFAHPADAMVSPANSFGIMDGGLDLTIRDRLGHGVQAGVQAKILDDYHGELPVGAAVIVATGHAQWPFLISAPTMRVPESVAQTVNAYAAFRAVLLAVRRHNESNPARAIRSAVCPGLGTGIGAMDAQRCAVQMRMAYRQAIGPARIPSFSQIHAIHHALRTS